MNISNVFTLLTVIGLIVQIYILSRELLRNRQWAGVVDVLPVIGSSVSFYSITPLYSNNEYILYYINYFDVIGNNMYIGQLPKMIFVVEEKKTKQKFLAYIFNFSGYHRYNIMVDHPMLKIANFVGDALSEMLNEPPEGIVVVDGTGNRLVHGYKFYKITQIYQQQRIPC